MTEPLWIGGVEDFYLIEQRDEDGTIQLGGLCYFYNGRAHTTYLETPKLAEASSNSDRDSGFGFGREESEEERERKQEIAEELLEEYDEFLPEDERFEIENRLERMTLSRLLRVQEQVEAEASADPEAEKRIARNVYEDDRFNRQFNQTDTEMLVDELGLEYNSDHVRMEEVHRRAKSLLKINK